MFFEEMLSALATLASPTNFAFLTLGVCLGLVLGILPGLGGMSGLALTLPFIFGMQPEPALAMLLGLMAVTTTSDTFPAILMGIPGTAGSQATVLDGFEMSKRGEGARALAAAFTSSMMGGVFGAVVLTGAIFVAKPIILAVGFGEQLMLILLAFTMVGMMTGVNPMRGLASVGVGLMLGAIGAAPSTGVVRFGFGTEYLIEPLKIIVVALALFALPEIIDLLRSKTRISEAELKPGQMKQGIGDVFSNWWLSMRCSGIGALVGALPGLGGTVVDWVAYGHAVQTTKDREKYGTGDVRGVIAPESANNAKEGGALIPTILFGIPGSGGMAILLGGFYLIGITPGIQIVTEQLDLVYVMIWSLALANIVGTAICIGFARPITGLTRIKYTIIAPLMIAVIYFASFQATHRWGDLLLLTALGTMGIFMKRFGWSRPAVLMGFILSGQVEASVYRTIEIYGFDVFLRPLSAFLFVLIIVSIIASVKVRARNKDWSKPQFQPEHKRPQIIFLAVLFILPFGLIIDTWNGSSLTNTFPIFASLVGLFFMTIYGAQMLFSKEAGTAFFDTAAIAPDPGVPPFGFAQFIVWMFGILAGTAVFGFVIAIAGFIFTFMRIRAHLSVLVSLLSALAFVGFLTIFSTFMGLHYPTGLLQHFVAMPWPLN
ncbi:MAG: tripartite tricarboxylate transporter permease [Cognatishimia sp.]